VECDFLTPFIAKTITTTITITSSIHPAKKKSGFHSWAIKEHTRTRSIFISSKMDRARRKKKKYRVAYNQDINGPITHKKKG
jgi:hypothetical protein